ncbi:MAG: radical SAM protein, partial [Desulfuromonadales bacterium]|nr:radical SAM protein [Desulfuromonadales bacterium]
QNGVTTVEIGCQSFCPQVLIAAERGHGPEAAGLAVARLRRCGLRVGLQLMPGLPSGDRGEAVASLHAALRLDPDFLRLYPAVVFQGTPLADDWRQGRYRPWSLQEAVDCCAELLWRCRQAAVPVVRTGLQADPALTTAIVAGPWHPAFGQLVRSRLWLRALTAAARQSGGGEAGVALADLSDALGHRRENLTALRQIFPSFTITARPERSRGFLALAGREFDLWQMAGYGAA